MKKNKIIKLFMIVFLVFFAFNTFVLAEETTTISETITCKANNLGKIRTDLKNVFNLLRIVVPLLIFGLSIFDFIKAITGKDEKAIKKAFDNFKKRIIYGLIFFFLPLIIDLLFGLFDSSSNINECLK